MPRMIDLGYRLVENGFSVLPIRYGKQYPGFRGHDMAKWQHLCQRQPTPAEVESWWLDNDHDGIGIACGWNGVVALDIDDERAVPYVASVLKGRQAPTKRGSKGFTGFFKDPTRSIAAHKLRAAGPDGRPLKNPMVEYLAGGSCCVVPPTWHPKIQRPYVWLRGDLAELLVRDLPVITPADVEAIKAALAPLLPVKREVEELNTVKPRDIADMFEIERKRYDGLARSAFNRAISDLTCLQDGRYNAVYATACTLGRWVHAGFLSESNVRAAIAQASRDNGLAEKRGDHPSIISDQITRGLIRSKNDCLPDLAKLGDKPGWRRAA